MKISVWDTYAKRLDGKIMHFDILVPSDLKDEDRIFSYGEEFLKSKTFQTANLTSKECKFCHIEQATDEVVLQIQEQGFSILEMENCD